MIKRLHLLVFKSYIGPLILTFFIAEFALIMQFLWLYISDLAGKGLEWSIIAELLMYSSAGLVRMAMPLAILLASVMTFGSLGENFELSAMKAAGISLQRIMIPLTLFSIILSIGMFFFSNNVVTYTNLKFFSLLYDVGNLRPEMSIKPGIFNRDIEEFGIKIKSKSANSNMMYDIMLYDHSNGNGNKKLTLADSGTMEPSSNQKSMIITMYHGKSYNEDSDEKDESKIYKEHHDIFDKETVIFEIKSNDLENTDPGIFKDFVDMKSIGELKKSSDSLEAALKKRKHEFEFSLNRSKFFKYERKTQFSKDPIYNTLDSLHRMQKPENLNVIENFDTVYSSLASQEKVIILEHAFDNAASIKKFLQANKDDIKERKKNISKHYISLHMKFTLSFACLIFFFIGAPLGAIIRKGGFGLPFIVAIIFFIVYYLISIMGRKFVEEGVMAPWTGMWLSSFLTLPLGALFTYKATTDSTLFNPNAYLEMVKRPFKVLEILYKDPSVVFHKDIEIPDNKTILSKITEIEKQALDLTLKTNIIVRSFKKLYFLHFKLDRSEIKSFADDYNKLYNILSVKFRDNRFEKAKLEKFPKIEKEKYEMTKQKLKVNFLMLTVGILPIGLLLMLNSYFKMKVLNQKIGIVNEQIKSFKSML